MATKKYLSLERLTEYDSLIKAEINSGDESVKSYVDTELAKKANSSHNHDDIYYTETEIDSKISDVNTSINNIVNGDTVVKKAEQANSATSADMSADAEKFGGQSPSYYAKSSDIPTGALADKDVVSESDLDSALAEKVNAAAEGNHSHSNKSVLDGITSSKVSAWDSSLDEAKTYTDTKTNGMATTTVVDTKISTHNTATDAHNDIRDLITGLTTRLNTLADSDDTTLDQMSELVAYIKNNKSLIDSITTTKVNVSDIIDNLTTNVADKPLSAAQGVAIKGLIDDLQTDVDGKADAGHIHDDIYYTESEIDTKIATINTAIDGKANYSHSHAISEVTNLQNTLDAKAAQTSLDSHTSNTTVHITSTERTNWNAAKTHADSAHAPSDAQANVIESIKVNGTAQTITSKSVDITVPTKASDIGAAESSHTHAISDITDLQTTLNNAASAISTNTASISTHTDKISALEEKVGDGFTEISSAEIQALFQQ